MSNTMDKLALVMWSGLSASLFTIGLRDTPDPPATPYCPDRQQIWEDTGRWASTVMNHCAEWWKPDDLDWCLYLSSENVDLDFACNESCDGRVDDLYDAMVSADLQRGFDPWPSDQLVCDCFSTVTADPDGDADDECEAAIKDVCTP